MSAATPDWIAQFPDPFMRGKWWRATNGDLTLATDWSEHFTDPMLAARWDRNSPLPPAYNAHLHRHRIPMMGTVHDAYVRAAREAHLAPFRDRHHETYLRTVLHVLHPDLTPHERDLIVRAGLTLTELDRAFAETGALDRDTIAFMAGLQ